MAYLRDTVFILKNEPFREQDSWITMYGREQGKMVAVARGVRKWRAKQLGHLEPLAKVEVMIAKGASFDKIAVAQVIEPMNGQRDKLEALAIQGAVCDLVDKLTHPMGEDDEVYFLLNELRAFFELEGPLSAERGRLVLSVFTLKLLNHLGYAVHVESCVVCRRSIVDRSWFSVEAGGLICEDCHRRQAEFYKSVSVSFSAVKLIKYLQHRPLADARLITAPSGLFIEVSDFAETFLQLAPLKVKPKGFETVTVLLR